MNGPLFLHSDPWLEQRYVIPEEGTCEEKKKESTEHVHLTQTSVHSPLKFLLLDATRFSKSIKVVRCTACVLRFFHNVARGKLEKRHGELDVEEIQEAEYYWIRYVQRNGFESELRAVKSRQQIPRQSPTRSLNAVLDDN
ncbi:Tigger transposable element-derived 6, partial, partial [Paramuricea clavata]